MSDTQTRVYHMDVMSDSKLDNMANVKEKSLVDALSYCSLRELPPIWDKENIYIKALAEVFKNDGTYGYVLLRKGADCKDYVVKDFGSCAMITKTISVHPFVFLESKWMPKFKPNEKKEAKIKWLKSMGVEITDESLTIKEIDKKILGVAITNAINHNNWK